MSRDCGRRGGVGMGRHGPRTRSPDSVVPLSLATHRSPVAVVCDMDVFHKSISERYDQRRGAGLATHQIVLLKAQDSISRQMMKASVTRTWPRRDHLDPQRSRNSAVVLVVGTFVSLFTVFDAVVP